MNQRIIIGQRGQRAITYSEFWEPRTMLQVSQATGIKRKNICWYVREKRIARALFPIGKVICPISKHRAMSYTSNAQRAWTHYVNLVRPEWEYLNDTDVLDLWKVIQTYVLGGFDDSGMSIDKGIADVWERRVKPIINGEARI